MRQWRHKLLVVPPDIMLQALFGLTEMDGVPPDVDIVAVQYDVPSNTFKFLLYHPSFDEVAPGCEAPVMLNVQFVDVGTPMAPPQPGCPAPSTAAHVNAGTIWKYCPPPPTFTRVGVTQGYSSPALSQDDLEKEKARWDAQIAAMNQKMDEFGRAVAANAAPMQAAAASMSRFGSLLAGLRSLLTKP